MMTQMLMLLANSLGAAAADYRPPGEPILPSGWLIDGGREFASGIAVSMSGGAMKTASGQSRLKENSV
jgi:hypothetical protein